MKVDKLFFEIPTLDLCLALLGKKLTHDGVGGYIVEVEAYIGPGDQAAHSYGGRRTARTEVMFGPPGKAYVYTIHRHHCFNIVSGRVGDPEAILVRALEPSQGNDWMVQRRGQKENLTNGPGRLCQALGITKAQYGWDLLESSLRISDGKAVKRVATGTRIGIDNTGEAREYPWRFWIDGNEHVSRTRKSLGIIEL